MAIRLSNLIGDPFAIATVSFGLIAWIVAIAGAGSSPQSHFPRFTWWGIVYELLIILLITFLYLTNTIELYKFTLVGLIAVAFVYTTNSANGLVYESNSGKLCCAAGCILLSMLNLIWIVYFGGHPESPTNQFIDSFLIKLHTHNHGQLSSDEKHDDDLRVAPAPEAFQDNNLRQSQNKTPYMLLSQLNGLENFSSADVRQLRDLTNSRRQTVIADEEDAPVFRYKARALYSYSANPEDINEISFTKDEILDVDDIDGKWWQARRATGEVGICPSNYVKLIE